MYPRIYFMLNIIWFRLFLIRSYNMSSCVYALFQLRCSTSLEWRVSIGISLVCFISQCPLEMSSRPLVSSFLFVEQTGTGILFSFQSKKPVPLLLLVFFSFLPSIEQIPRTNLECFSGAKDFRQELERGTWPEEKYFESNNHILLFFWRKCQGNLFPEKNIGK